MSSHESKDVIKLKKGDLIGIAAPSGAFNADDFENGLSCLIDMGFEPLVPDGLFESSGYFAGSDAHRAGIVNQLYENPGVKAVMCARGGYGAMRILDRIDGTLVRRKETLLLGFSDITALLTDIHERWGGICHHGPVVCSLGRIDQVSLDRLERFLYTGEPGPMNGDGARILVPGRGEGHLMGGNLTTLNHMTGTPFQPDLAGAVLMLEDVGEAPYRIDRMLTQMKSAGMFDHVSAVVGGRFESCGDSGSLDSVFMDIFGDKSIPLVMDFPFGHGGINHVFPIGVTGRLDTQFLTLEF